MSKRDFGDIHFSCLKIVLVANLYLTQQSISEQLARPNCPEKCGDITIPYPFGIGDDCHYAHPRDGIFYNITCNTSNNPIVPTYGNGLEVVDIDLNGEFRIRNQLSYACYNDGEATYSSTYQIRVTRFALSTTQNIAGAIGCDTAGIFRGTRMSSTSEFRSGCLTLCTNQTDVSEECSGIGCCLGSIPSGVTNITSVATSLLNHTYNNVSRFNPCSVAFVVAKDLEAENEMPFSIESIITKDATFFLNSSNLMYPTVYNWSIGTQDCIEAQANEEYYLCKGHSVCLDDLPGQWGYRCQCEPGFEGNPYLYDCQDDDECKNSSRNACEKQEYCVNTLGNYSCICPNGYNGEGTHNRPCILIDDANTTSRRKLLLAIKIILGVGGCIIVFLIAGFYFHWQHGNKKLEKMRKTFFDQNGGNILLQKLARRDVPIGSMVKMFTVEELKKATNNYSENNIIGQGGFGKVYKGVLPNNQLVAIKKSLKVDSNQVEQFINEVVALSQINNMNVVKLLGCCLETEVPLLVYEFISNGNLYEHLHDEGKSRFLSWDVRLRIAIAVADVLAYLHTTISIPIIHRDVKSANILLDDKYTAKVADFGASKLAPTGEEQLMTMVQGTWGYLDPEYVQTGELTEKSDVYSFGVVLVELLTREKAISYAKPENDRSLANYFLQKVKENCLIQILDDKIVSDETIEQLKEVAQLAKRCLKLKGNDRPIMKEVARELDRIKRMHTHPWSINGVQLQEESEYLLHNINEVNSSGYVDEAINDPLRSQSRVVQMLPLKNGR